MTVFLQGNGIFLNFYFARKGISNIMPEYWDKQEIHSNFDSFVCLKTIMSLRRVHGSSMRLHCAVVFIFIFSPGVVDLIMRSKCISI